MLEINTQGMQTIPPQATEPQAWGQKAAWHQALEDRAGGSGYYTVHMDMDGRKIPYVVFARSDYHAARLVRDATGYMAEACDVEGPYSLNTEDLST